MCEDTSLPLAPTHAAGARVCVTMRGVYKEGKCVRLRRDSLFASARLRPPVVLVIAAVCDGRRRRAADDPGETR